METLHYDNGSFTDFGVILSTKSWEKLKKIVDKQLYKKYNNHADFGEIRLYFNEAEIDIEAHCAIQNGNTRRI